MGRRVQQREQTRSQILDAAIAAFADRGFHGASTRQIATLAGVNQGLITYHFRTKAELWRAVMTLSFERLDSAMAGQEAEQTAERPEAQRLETERLETEPREHARQMIRAYVQFAAAHPNFFRLMLDAGKSSGERLQWIVETHLRSRFGKFRAFAAPMGFEGDDDLAAHFYFVLIGAGSMMFVLEPECKRLTGIEPRDPAVVERHAELVARLLVP